MKYTAKGYLTYSWVPDLSWEEGEEEAMVAVQILLLELILVLVEVEVDLSHSMEVQPARVLEAHSSWNLQDSYYYYCCKRNNKRRITFLNDG